MKNYWAQKVELPKKLKGEYTTKVVNHEFISDEKGIRYLIQLALDNKTYDYYVFPSENDFKKDEKANLLKSQTNYLISVFSNILNKESGKQDLAELVEELKTTGTEFVANFTYNSEYNRNNVSFYPKAVEESAVDLVA